MPTNIRLSEKVDKNPDMHLHNDIPPYILSIKHRRNLIQYYSILSYLCNLWIFDGFSNCVIYVCVDKKSWILHNILVQCMVFNKINKEKLLQKNHIVLYYYLSRLQASCTHFCFFLVCLAFSSPSKATAIIFNSLSIKIQCKQVIYCQ